MTTQLEDLSLGTRIAIAAVTIALTAAVLFVLQAESQQHPALTNTEYDERLVQLEREAVEVAFVEHVKKLFSIWMTDYSEAPPKAIKGAAQARSAYIRSMTEIDKRGRERELREKKE